MNHKFQFRASQGADSTAQLKISNYRTDPLAESSSLDSGYWTLDVGYAASFRMADGGVNLECWNGRTVGAVVRRAYR